MSDLLSSKVVVVEEVPRVRGIPSGSTSVTGIVGLTERGPIGEPILCNSPEDYERVFGGFIANAMLPLAVMGFFENGGSQLWVVRTVHYTDSGLSSSATATRASGVLIAVNPADGVSSEVLRVHGKTPGTYANRVEVEVRPPTSGAADTFDLAVVEDGAYREIFIDLSLNPGAARHAPQIVNSSRRGSALVMLEAIVGVSQPPDVQMLSLMRGDDGLTGLDDTDFIGSEVSKTGLYAFDTIQNLSLLMIPDRATPAVHQAMVRYCEIARGGLVFAVLDPPTNQSAIEIVNYVESTAALLGLSEHAAIYWPRLEVLNPARGVLGSEARVVVAPSGILCGVFARTDSARPGGIYDPPAGIDRGRMFGVLGFETDEVLEERKRDLVYPKRINPLTTGPGLPRFIDGSRTLKGDGNFSYVAERRGVSFIERSLKQGLQFARHRNNNEALRAQVRRTVTAFLLTQMNNGAFRSREPAKAFFIDVSERLNTPLVVFEGKLIVRVGLATNKPAEFIILRIFADTREVEAQLSGI